MVLKYQESQYLSHLMLIIWLVFISFIWCLNNNEFVLQITRSKVLIMTSACTETSVTFGPYIRISICICACFRQPLGSSIWRNTSTQSLQLILIIITINLLQMVVDIAKYYSNHFTVAETASTIFIAMASNILCKSPYSVRVRENTDQRKLGIWTLFTQWRFLMKNYAKFALHISILAE